MNFKNFTTGYRNIRKNGVYSIINIAGLALGIAVVVLILFWVVDELSFDKFHKNLNQIYTVYEHQEYSDGQDLFTPCTPFPLGKELVSKYPEIENATTFTNIGDHLLKSGNKEYKEGAVYCADKEFLNVFSFKLKEGNKDVMASPDKIIINEEVAHLFYGDEPALGKIIKIDDGLSFTVGAVMEDMPINSTLNFKAILPVDFLNEAWGVDLTQWGNNWPRTSVLMAQEKDYKNFEGKIITLCKDNGQPNTTLHIFPFKNERLYSYSGKNNRIQYIYQFIAIAFIIILIASINFINLSTATAEKRRPEVGVRKVMGAGKKDILSQFLIEKGMMIFTSIILSIILVLLFIPIFSSVSDKHISFGLLQNQSMIFMLFLVVATVLLISVLYPSFYLSSFSPVLALKNAANKKVTGFNLKNFLVVVQFILSVILISGSIAISKQIKYINNYDLGYNKANLVYLSLTGESKNKYDIITQKIKQLSGVTNISLTDNLPLYGTSSSWGYDWEGKDPDKRVLISQISVDRNYFKTMGISFIEGTTFPNICDRVVRPEDMTTPMVILNKEAIRRMGMDNPVGKFFGRFNNKKGIIGGVVDDFHFQSLHNGVEPLLITPLTNNPDNIIVRIDPANFSQTISKIKNAWKEILPQSTCEVGFFDESLKNLYNSEVRISGLFRYFSFIAIFISCIGLFGLSLYIIERRRKEIGVRKVNGARISEVVFLLNKDFITWVIAAFIIATPIAYYTMNKWLENFAYKTDLSWWIFALAGLLALGIALVTVSWQSYRAASKNPVEALRYE